MPARRALLVTLALNVVVVAGKQFAGLIAGSLSVISDAIHKVTATIYAEPTPQS